MSIAGLSWRPKGTLELFITELQELTQNTKNWRLISNNSLKEKLPLYTRLYTKASKKTSIIL